MAAITAITAEGAVDVRDRGDVRRQVKLVVLFALVSLALLVFFRRVDDFTIVSGSGIYGHRDYRAMIAGLKGEAR